MELIATLLVAFPIGYFIQQRLAAYVVYVGLHSYLFTFQTASLLREWVGGSTEAFAKNPDTTPWAYGLVNLLIYGVGIGLVTVGGIIAGRRRAYTSAAVEFAP